MWVSKVPNNDCITKAQAHGIIRNLSFLIFIQ